VEFGEARMAELSRGARRLSAEALRRRLLECVTEFCAGGFEDDATLLVVAVYRKTIVPSLCDRLGS
jgi:serine phosphatase RsbU (regulator of sigma subunit)